MKRIKVSVDELKYAECLARGAFVTVTVMAGQREMGTVHLPPLMARSFANGLLEVAEEAEQNRKDAMRAESEGSE